jgi:ABC-type multidrug transport system ATPase subunit
MSETAMPQAATPGTPAAPAIETRGLSRRFGAVEAVRDLSLVVPAGSVCGLVGPNGAGKTTTLSLLSGFLRPTTGTVQVLGCDAHDREALGARVAALPQDAPLPAGMTALGALNYWAELGGLPPSRAREEARRALEIVGLTAMADRRCEHLSHGTAKRVALAQAFLGEPELLLLDEPWAGLDPRAAHEIREIVRARRGRATVLVSSHDLAQLEELCDYVAILDRGRLAQQGPVSEVTGRGDLVRVLLADAEAAAVLAAVRLLPFAADAVFAAERRVLQVRLAGRPAEDAVPELLRAVLGAGGRVLEVSRGRRLEERVLEIL